MTSPVAPHVAPRGVYLAPYVNKGHRLYYAVDSNAEWRAERYVRVGSDSQEAIDELWEILEEADPQADQVDRRPKLAVVR